MKKVIILGLVAVAGAANANLVVNPGFETGDTTGWTVTNLGSFSGVGAAPGVNHSGNFHFFMGSTTDANRTNIFQDIATVAGQTYSVSFWAYDIDPATPSADMVVTFGGTQIGPNRPAAGYTMYSGNVVATSASTTLRFTGWELTQYINVDDFAVDRVVPEPATMAVLGLGIVPFLRRRRK